MSNQSKLLIVIFLDLLVPRLYAHGIRPNNAVELYTWEKNFRIICYTYGYPKPRVTWKRNGIEILDSTNSSVNTRVYQQIFKWTDFARSDLFFKEVYCHDAGNYTCESSIERYDYVRIKYVNLICEYFMCDSYPSSYHQLYDLSLLMHTISPSAETIMTFALQLKPRAKFQI